MNSRTSKIEETRSSTFRSFEKDVHKNSEMVNTDIPQHYTASPSSVAGTPHLTINRDATKDLDSSTAFEGPEKLLEVWFAPSANTLPSSARSRGLKAVHAAEWTEMLDLVHCKVLSVIESEHCDAYLLSESSMFVFPHKLVLKTCGTTTLLYGLPRILQIAALKAGFPHTPADVAKGTEAIAATYRVFYSRKNYLYPDQQRGPHRSWRDEVRTLDRLFRKGSAYMIGKMNGEHWYLYLTEPDTRLTPPGTPEHEKLAPSETDTKIMSLPEPMTGLAIDGHNHVDEPQDETLEVLMTDLDEDNAKQFYLENAAAVAEGKYFQEMHNKTRRQMSDALGVINDESAGGSFVKLARGASFNDYDVFEQTSSDHAFSDDEDAAVVAAAAALPSELTIEGHALGTIVSDTSGLADLYPAAKYPEARIDAYLFTPCGFSANGVVPEPSTNHEGPRTTHYFTVHVTPEPQCSYASFETNVPAAQTGRETAEVVEQVVNIFKPGRFSVTLFEAKPVVSDKGRAQGETVTQAEKKASSMEAIKGYRRVDRIVHDLDGYDLVFRYYERHDWKGGAPRLGEMH